MSETDPFEKSVSEAETSVIGSLLRSPSLAPIAAAELLPEQFYDARKRGIYALILELEAEREGTADVVAVAHRMEDTGKSGLLGGREFLLKCVEAVPTAAYLENHLRIVAAGDKKRRFLRMVSRAHSEVAHGNVGAEQMARVLDSELMAIMRPSQEEHFRKISDIDRDFRAKVQERTAPDAVSETIPTPIRALNLLLKGGGLNPGDLVILAARPSMGKTALAFDFVDESSARGPTAFFSLEMAGSAILERYYARAGGLGRMIGTAIGPTAQKALEETSIQSNYLRAKNLWIGDEPGQTLAKIRAQCLSMKRRDGLRLVTVDYLGLVRSEGASKNASKEERTAELSAGFKALALELRCPVVLLAQLNRGVESRTDRRPVLSDLRDSGAIEQDADVVLMLYRPSQYDQDQSERADEILVRKNRQFKVGTAYANFDGPAMRWRDNEPKNEIR